MLGELRRAQRQSEKAFHGSSIHRELRRIYKNSLERRGFQQKPGFGGTDHSSVWSEACARQEQIEVMR